MIVTNITRVLVALIAFGLLATNVNTVSHAETISFDDSQWAHGAGNARTAWLGILGNSFEISEFQSVPEPASAAILGLVSLPLLLRRRR